MSLVRKLPPSEVGADEARRLADEVLAGRGYVEAARPPSLRDRAFEWIAERFTDLLNSLSSVGGRGWFAWVIIIAFAAFIIFLLRRLLRNVGRVSSAKVSADPVVVVSGDVAAEEWLNQAAAAEAAGDWRTAVRCRHRALVTTLVRRQVVPSGPSQTAGEIQQVVAERRPQAAATMQQATWLFKDTWYGWITADATSSSDFAALSAEVLRLTEQPEVASTPELVSP